MLKKLWQRLKECTVVWVCTKDSQKEVAQLACREAAGLHHDQSTDGLGGASRTGVIEGSLPLVQPRIRKPPALLLQLPLDHNKLATWMLEHGFQLPPILPQLPFNSHEENHWTWLCHCRKTYVFISLLAKSTRNAASVSPLLPNLTRMDLSGRIEITSRIQL